MSKWKDVIIGNHIDLISGYAFKSGDFLSKQTSGTLPVIKIKNVANGDVNLKEVVYHKSSPSLDKYIITKGDVLVAMTGNHPHAQTQVVGDVSMYKLDEKALLNQRVGKLVVKDNTDLDFVYYLFKSEEVRYNLANKSSGSANQANISKGDILGLNVLMPCLNIQKGIGSILKSLDNKIDLLHSQNATLEKMAETLFRQWFVEEPGQEWKEIKLGTIVDTINGVSYKSDDLSSSKTAMVTLKSFDRNGGFRIDGFKEYTGKYKEQHILKEGDLVVAHTDITQEADVIGNPAVVIANPKYDTIIFSMDLVKVISKDKNYSNEFLYLLMKSKEFKEHCLGYSNGSTVLHLSKKAIPEYEMKLPPKTLINEFSINVKPLVQKQFRNQTQIRILTSLRDTLLPRLMNREVTIEQ